MKDHPVYKVWLLGRVTKKKSFRCLKHRMKFIVKKKHVFIPQSRG